MTSQFANELKCLYCGTPNPCGEWPVAGDLVPFYYQPQTGGHNLPITCPDCGKTWYVVWDADPGPIQQLSLPANRARSGASQESGSTIQHSGSVNPSFSDDDILAFIEAPDSSTRSTSHDAGYESIDLDDITVPESVIEMIPESVARENSVFPVAFDGERLRIATSNREFFDVEEKLKFILNCGITWVMASDASVLAAINRHYGLSETESVDSMLQEFAETNTDAAESAPSDNPVECMIRLMIRSAVQGGASCVHFHCRDNCIDVAMRVGRELVEMLPPPKHVWAGMVMKLKEMVGIDRDVDRWPVVCNCHHCGTRYVLGANASMDVGPPPAHRPDRVKLMIGEPSWSVTLPLPALPDSTPTVLLEARKRRATRRWRCDKCRNVHIYDWSRPGGMRQPLLSQGSFTLRIEDPDADVRVRFRLWSTDQGERVALKLRYTAQAMPQVVTRGNRDAVPPIVCTCTQCQTCYVLGVNAVAMTIAEAMNAIKQRQTQKRDQAQGVGASSTEFPDAIMLEIPGESWPLDRPLPSAPDGVSPEIITAQKNGATRFWQCGKCDNVQQYDWSEARRFDRRSSASPALPAKPEGRPGKVRCPSCNKSLVAGQEHLGRKVRCPTCGHRFVLQTASLITKGTAGSQRVKLHDPFQLDFEEIKDERSFEWLSDVMPEFNADRLNTLLQGSSEDRQVGMRITDSAAKRFPDFWIPWSWSAVFRLRDGKPDAAQDVLERAISTCCERAALYEGLARVAHERGDMIGLLGWSIKSFVAADRIASQSGNHCMLYIAQIAQMHGARDVADSIRCEFPFTFDVEIVRRLQAAYDQCSVEQLMMITEYLNQFELVYRQKQEAEQARASAALTEAGFPAERHPFCRHCGNKMTYRGTDTNDSEFFVFNCDTCGIPTGGKIDDFPSRD